MHRPSAVTALVLILLQTPVSRADEHEHVAKAGEISIVHTWARAAEAGQTTLVFMEIENAGASDTLERVDAEVAASARIVGITAKDGVQGTQEVGAVEIPQGEFGFDPGGLAVELVGLKVDLKQGGETEIELHFKNAGIVHVHAEVEAADANQHSHAGHAH